MSVEALQRRSREARDWLMEACFPLWAEKGVYGRVGFLEALDLQHRPVEAPLARVRVQARQTYVFSQALHMGWQPARAQDLVRMGVNVLDTVCRRPDGVLGRNIDLERGVLADDTADLYDTAFGLYALGSAYRGDGADGAEVPGRLIAEISRALEGKLADPTGGYAESLPRPEYRLQNPHMHLFEASLELYAKTGNERHMTRASQIRDLFMTRFLDKTTGTLGERFMPESWAIPNGEAGEIIEPGHQFEWVWLLARYALLTRGRLPDEARRLYELACRTLDKDGRAIQSTLQDGTPVDASRRTWPQTEALKAHLTLWRAGDSAAGARAVASFDVLMDEYLTPEGGWSDHYDGDGYVRSANMPASTGYHVVLAFAELISAVEA